jgi:hypothetical protein
MTTKGLTFQLDMGLCNAPRAASDFRASPPVPSTCMTTRTPGLYLDHSALALKSSYAAQLNAQRHTSPDQMCVHRLHLPTAPVSCSALALKEPGPRPAGRNYPRRGLYGIKASTPATSCFCLCEAGAISSVPAGIVFPPVHPAP